MTSVTLLLKIVVLDKWEMKHKSFYCRNLMRLGIYLIAFFIGSNVFGQERDKRAELGIRGRVTELSVSPDEGIWIVTATGKTYYTLNIDSNWHYGRPLEEDDYDEYSLNSPNLNRISFFNNDTAILTGYILYRKQDRKHNGYYLTMDGGQNWKLLDFGGDSWIYSVCTDKQGNAWLGGLSKEVHYSEDFGLKWKSLKLPLVKSDRIYALIMIDPLNGIVGSDNNEILITTNNWKTAENIPTPLDQNKYQKDEPWHSNDRISKILLWKNFIVLNQQGRVFYSERENIDWKSFPINVFDFELDSTSMSLIAISDSLKIISFTSPTEFRLLTNERLSTFPIDIKVVNGSLYAVSGDGQVYKVNSSGVTRTIPYTTDRKIEAPQIVKQGKNLLWGTNGNQIYLADKNEREWYRENALDFYINDFNLLNDSIAILWDGFSKNYIYSLSDHIPNQYFHDTPLNSFLAFPINSITINSGSGGCFHGYNDEVKYKLKNDSVFETSKVNSEGFETKKPSTFKNRISSSRLTLILREINSNPSKNASIEDFHITENDKRKYLKMVDDLLKKKGSEYYNRKKPMNKDFYYSIPAKLDTLDNKILREIFNSEVQGWSTTRYWFTVQIINQNNDTLNIERSNSIKSISWNLPWKFEYNGQHFNCYSVEFSRFINSCIPDDFTDKNVFDNSRLIMEIADFLWTKEE